MKKGKTFVVKGKKIVKIVENDFPGNHFVPEKEWKKYNPDDKTKK